MESYKLLFGKDFEDFVSEYVSSSLKEKILLCKKNNKKIIKRSPDILDFNKERGKTI